MIRAVSDVPVLVATARDDEGLIVALLDAGADDYLVKPFEPGHLEARIRAVLRRCGQPPRTGRRADVPLERRRAERRPGAGAPRPSTASLVDLTRLEFDLLAYLAAHPGRVVSRKELLREVWQRTDSARTVDVHLSWLRRKLGDDPADPRFIHVHRGVGVLLEDQRCTGA